MVPWEDNPDRPFCSERCRVVDLGSWADERFRVPGEPVSEEAPSGSENGTTGKKHEPSED
jgi:endogenous inhibitor of DNA gyrase (YacG/DUF329 family)